MTEKTVIELDDGNILAVQATDDDVRLSLTVGKPSRGQPTTYHVSLEPLVAMRFAQSMNQSAEIVHERIRLAQEESQ